jgi:hypothetical protein
MLTNHPVWSNGSPVWHQAKSSARHTSLCRVGSLDPLRPQVEDGKVMEVTGSNPHYDKKFVSFIDNFRADRLPAYPHTK